MFFQLRLAENLVEKDLKKIEVLDRYVIERLQISLQSLLDLGYFDL